MVRLPRNEKQTYRLNSRPQMWPMGLTFTITLTSGFMKVKHDLDLWPHTWPWPWIFMVKFWNSRIPEWEGRLTLHKGGGSRSFMTMTMTIWWPRSGVWIYQIVTGVTSVVGVPSTHLVVNVLLSGQCSFLEGSNIWNFIRFYQSFWVSKQKLENAWKEWPLFCHDVSWPPSQEIRFWWCPILFDYFNATFTQ